MLKAVVIFWVSLALSFTCSAQGGFDGFWQSIDDESGEVTAIWQIETQGNELIGKIVDYPNAKASDVCKKCTGKLSVFLDKPIKGTAWMQFSQFDDGIWEEGFIIDSEKGKKYTAKIWLDGDDLKLRGYVGFFYRTQTWLRADTAQLH
jgi:uncharacterized protein (DUF2147 family)